MELEELTKEKKEGETVVADAMDKASKFMAVVRHGEWDGSRVDTRHTVQQLRHKVRVPLLLRLVGRPCVVLFTLDVFGLSICACIPPSTPSG